MSEYLSTSYDNKIWQRKGLIGAQIGRFVLNFDRLVHTEEVGCKIRSNPIIESGSIRSLNPVKPITESGETDHVFFAGE